MKKAIPYFLLIIVNCQLLTAQDTVALRFSKNITASHLSQYLHTLASDEFEGRETGQKGQKLAAAYIAEHFKNIGIPELKSGGYFQQYFVQKESWDGYAVSLTDSLGKSLIDYKGIKPEKNLISFNSICPSSQGDYKNLLFLGYGIKSDNYDDYKGSDVKGKVLLIMEKEPMDKDSNYLVTKTKQPSDWSQNRQKKLSTAKEQGASAIIFILNDFDETLHSTGRFISYSPLKLIGKKELPVKENIPCFYTGTETIDALLAKNKSVKDIQTTIRKTTHSMSFSVKANFKFDVKKKIETISAENVLGYIEGSDLKSELVVITGHYDHLGKEGNKIYYGADDDGSGTSAVMELAQAFNIAKKQGQGPRRSMLFMTVSGEEKGLLGSEYYSEHPVFPLENTVADLNIDMIGRIDEKHKGDPNYIYLIGSDKLSTTLHQISETANATYSKLELDYTYNDPKDPNHFYYRSDHYNFAKHNIPIIFYFNGVHADYHKPTDTVDKINFEKMEKITRLVFFTAWELANRTERIKVDVKSDFENK